jgi:hypothetical protein
MLSAQLDRQVVFFEVIRGRDSERGRADERRSSHEPWHGPLHPKEGADNGSPIVPIKGCFVPAELGVLVGQVESVGKREAELGVDGAGREIFRRGERVGVQPRTRQCRDTGIPVAYLARDEWARTMAKLGWKR